MVREHYDDFHALRSIAPNHYLGSTASTLSSEVSDRKIGLVRRLRWIGWAASRSNISDVFVTTAVCGDRRTELWMVLEPALKLRAMRSEDVGRQIPAVREWTYCDARQRQRPNDA
jgi:hypothetical protein